MASGSRARDARREAVHGSRCRTKSRGPNTKAPGANPRRFRRHGQNRKDLAGPPRRGLMRRRKGPLPQNRRKDLVLVLKGETERKKNLPLRVHAAVHALLHAMNRPQSHFGLTSKLSLRHELVFTKLSYPVRHALFLSVHRIHHNHTPVFRCSRSCSRSTSFESFGDSSLPRSFLSKFTSLEPFLATSPCAGCRCRKRAENRRPTGTNRRSETSH